MTFTSLIAAIVFGFSSCQNPAPTDQTAAPTDTSSVVFTNGITQENTGSYSGPVALSGTIQSATVKKVYLYSTYGRTNTVIDSAAINSGAFDFGTIEVSNGFYMIGSSETDLAAIILNPREKEVKLNIRGSRFSNGTTAVSSPENQAWQTYAPQEVQLQKAIKDAMVAAHKSAVKTEYEKIIRNKEQELSQLQQQLIGQYPNTYFAKILTWKQEPYKGDVTRYWDNIDFADESIIRSLVLSDRIQNYMRAFSGGKEAGFINCIAAIAEKAKASDVVLEFALNQMMIGFYESGMENLSVYIIDTYVNGDACGDADLSNIIKNNAEGIIKLAMGNVPPNITGKDINGRSVDLFKTAAAKKYTLVMFWSSWCEHCQGEAPEVVSCYAQWKDKGFEIFAYSVDEQEALWKNAVTDRGFEFINMCGYKKWDSQAARDYRITKTPGFFLLDQSGKIVLKPKSIREVQAFLKSNIGQ